MFEERKEKSMYHSWNVVILLTHFKSEETKCQCPAESPIQGKGSTKCVSPIMGSLPMICHLPAGLLYSLLQQEKHPLQTE